MLGTYYYHEIIRKTIVSFGTLFNAISIRHDDKSGNTYSELKVPLAYGPSQKFLARLEQQADLNKPVGITLPRMSFEINNVSYDASRKSGITQTFKASDGTNIKKVFTVVTLILAIGVPIELNDVLVDIFKSSFIFVVLNLITIFVGINLVSKIAKISDEDRKVIIAEGTLQNFPIAAAVASLLGLNIITIVALSYFLISSILVGFYAIYKSRS